MDRLKWIDARRNGPTGSDLRRRFAPALSASLHGGWSRQSDGRARSHKISGAAHSIHGTNAPHTIGTVVSSGRFRLTNPELIDFMTVCRWAQRPWSPGPEDRNGPAPRLRRSVTYGFSVADEAAREPPALIENDSRGLAHRSSIRAWKASRNSRRERAAITGSKDGTENGICSDIPLRGRPTPRRLLCPAMRGSADDISPAESSPNSLLPERSRLQPADHGVVHVVRPGNVHQVARIPPCNRFLALVRRELGRRPMTTRAL